VSSDEMPRCPGCSSPLCPDCARRRAFYGTVADVIEALPKLVTEKRRRREWTLRGVAEQTGVSFVTVARAENGKDLRLSSAVALLRWLAG
jgi:hypothetical protein